MQLQEVYHLFFHKAQIFSTGGSDNPSNSTAQRSIADPQLVAPEHVSQRSHHVPRLWIALL